MLQLGMEIKINAELEAQIIGFDELLRRFLTVVNQFPNSARGEAVCGVWNIKDVLAHLSAWNRLTIRDLSKLRLGETIDDWIEDSQIDSFNAMAVAQVAEHSWGTIYTEFIASSHTLLMTYRGLTPQEWQVAFGPDATPYSAMLVDIAHYTDHLEQLKEFLVGVTNTWPGTTTEV